MLLTFSEDITKYITYVCDNLCLITAADDSMSHHNNLLTYIFTHLTFTNITPFKDQVQKWHVSYLEAEL